MKSLRPETRFFGILCAQNTHALEVFLVPTDTFDWKNLVSLARIRKSCESVF
jgi:hypothetical protein